MAKMTIGFGLVLMALGVWGYMATGSVHPTALIPTWFGLALSVAGWLADTEDSKRRMVWMHVAVTVGLIGFLGAGARVIVEYRNGLKDMVAVEDQAAMAAICMVFVGLCVRSFIAARKARKAEA